MSSEAMTNTKAKARVNVRKMAQVAMLGAIAVVLMLFEIPLPFAPSFYEIDFSEVPVLVGCFTMGPLAGVAIELVKILLNLVINGTATAGVGELANFLIGWNYSFTPGVFAYPAGYHRYTSERGMLTSLTLPHIKDFGDDLQKAAAAGRSGAAPFGSDQEETGRGCIQAVKTDGALHHRDETYGTGAGDLRRRPLSGDWHGYAVQKGSGGIFRRRTVKCGRHLRRI